MNMQALMKQAKNLQNEMMKAQDEINKMTFTGNNSFVSVIVNGQKVVLEVKIDDTVNLADIDKEMFQDIIVLAINNAFEKVNMETERKMGKFSNSMPGLF